MAMIVKSCSTQLWQNQNGTILKKLPVMNNTCIDLIIQI